MAQTRVIPIVPVVAGAAAAVANAHARLVRAGFMQMMTIGEPRLSEFVAKYEALGYAVEVVPFDTSEVGSEPGGATGSATGGATEQASRAASPFGGTIYVRKRSLPAGDASES